MADHDELRMAGVMEQGYGITPKSVMQDKRLTIEAKAIYAYIASYAGSGTTAFPGKKRIADDLNISEERLYNHRKLLIKYGYLTVTQERGPGGTLGKTVYTLEAIAIERPDTDKPRSENPCTDKPRSDKPCSENPSYNNNSSNNNSSCNNNRGKSNRAKPSPAAIVDLFNSICVSFSKVTKVSNSRKTAINARLNDYSLGEIKRAFEMMEASDFLKGSNDRGWKATFDWAMKDANMAKILDGNYSDHTHKPTPPKTDRYANIEEEETL